MKTLIALCVMLLLGIPSYADDVTSTLTWVSPETRTDGSLLSPDNIAEYRVYYGVDITEPLSKASTFVPIKAGTLERLVARELAPRPEEYIVSFAVTTVDTDGRESALSDTVTKSFLVSPTASPGPPTQLDFILNCELNCMVLEVRLQ